jgi:hypothetical protein
MNRPSLPYLETFFFVLRDVEIILEVSKTRAEQEFQNVRGRDGESGIHLRSFCGIYICMAVHHILRSADFLEQIFNGFINRLHKALCKIEGMFRLALRYQS